MNILRYRLQEANPDNNGGGGGAGEWLKPFGEHAKTFESFKTPADLAKAWGDTQTELTGLKGKTFDFRSLADPADEKATKLLGRFTDGKTFLKTFIEAQDKIRSGEIAKPLAADATPEQVKAWREANGIPADAKGYFEKLPDGLKIADDDKPTFEKLGARMHALNVSPAVFHETVKFYNEEVAAKEAAETEANKKVAAATRAVLEKAWGSDAKANFTNVRAQLEKNFGKEATLAMMGEATADGNMVGNSAHLMQVLAEWALSKNPAAHILPGGGEGDMKSIGARKAEIQKLMADKGSDYWRGPKSAAMQDEYKKLVEAEARLAA
jgi:hypothetical protein